MTHRYTNNFARERSEYGLAIYAAVFRRSGFVVYITSPRFPNTKRIWEAMGPEPGKYSVSLHPGNYLLDQTLFSGTPNSVWSGFFKL